ncbi:MAG: hypothetical protein RR416_02445 [Clostridia bacterium]
MLGMLLAEKIKPVVNVGNIMFYLIIAGLVIAVSVIIVLFTKSERYKIKVREAYMEKNKEYQAPVVVKVFQDENKDQIASGQESLNQNEPTIQKEIVDEKADKKQ